MASVSLALEYTMHSQWGEIWSPKLQNLVLVKCTSFMYKVQIHKECINRYSISVALKFHRKIAKKK